MKKKDVSLILNILIIIFELIGFIVTIKVNSRISYEFFTEDSNILMLFSSLLFVIYLLLNKKIPSWLKQFKYLSTVCLTLTFFVVLLILAPMYNFNYGYMLFHQSMLYQHLICPILSIVTFIFFDDLRDYNKRDNFIGISFTLVYAIVLIALNLINVIEGPYPFLMVRNQSLLASLIWLITIPSLSYFFAYGLRRLNHKYNR